MQLIFRGSSLGLSRAPFIMKWLEGRWHGGPTLRTATVTIVAGCGSIARSDDLSDKTLFASQLLCTMNQTPAKPQAILLWRQLNLAAHRAEMLLATIGLTHVRGVGAPAPTGLFELAQELRALANKQRELVLLGFEARASRRVAGDVPN